MKLFRDCRLAYKLKYIDGHPDFPGVPAISGIYAHKVLEIYGKDHWTPGELVDEHVLFDVVFPTVCADLSEEIQEDVRWALNRVNWPVPDHAKKIQYEIRLGRDAEGNSADFHKTDYLRGILDIVFETEADEFGTPKTLHIRDWKTGRVKRDNRFQSKIYVALASAYLPEYKRIVVQFVYPRLGYEGEEFVYDADGIYAAVYDVDEAIKSVRNPPDYKPTPSIEGCVWCPARLHCDIAKDVITGINAVFGTKFTNLDHTNVSELADKVIVLADIVKSGKAVLKKYAENAGPIETSDGGSIWEIVYKKGEGISAVEAIQIMLDLGYTWQDMFRNKEFGVRDINKFRKLCGKGSKLEDLVYVTNKRTFEPRRKEEK